MTDNEKRAHEFALAVLPKMFDFRADEAAQAGVSNFAIDFYAEYLTAYKKVLDSFNRDFPEGKQVFYQLAL